MSTLTQFGPVGSIHASHSLICHKGKPYTSLNSHVISGFRCKVNENCSLLRCYAVSHGNFLLTFQRNLSVPSSRVKKIVLFTQLNSSNVKQQCTGNLSYLKKHTGLTVTVSWSAGLSSTQLEFTWTVSLQLNKSTMRKQM